MIARPLLAAVWYAQRVAAQRPERLPDALQAIVGQAERLVDLQGYAAAPLRQAGQRMIATIFHACACADVRGAALRQLEAEAKLVQRLEETVPCDHGPAGSALWAVPRHWLPQVVAGASNRPFTVVDGGRL
ncbi:hypothetical protein HB662_02100 [Roseomonas frigidaquae]|uniref:Uncharacterized protein n=1 Tax=Falsiroseomonas frigidaquae TaxID=487318 RepID=A0ABX1ESG7_9PROT|nr:hypothetical protein [Falsiroseomonas frigidaquae]NKE43551.1 hypothetical protein [Falsiroseomonas frigidaquae]